MKQKLLIQTQLSNYDTAGRFILECDSGYQMVAGRVREMLKNNQSLDVTIMCPFTSKSAEKNQLITDPWDINQDMWEKYGPDGENRLHFFEHAILPNALATRYDFDWANLSSDLGIQMHKFNAAEKFDAVYINDPMHLRNFKAMFHVVGGYQPKFYVHSHFIDNPASPKFPKECSLWLGQCEAAIRADYNFWQCESAMNVYFNEMQQFFNKDVVEYVKQKSMPWDDGYSAEEINIPPDLENIRFDRQKFLNDIQGKAVIFVPNRIGGRGRSSDYTNCGKFMFDVLPGLRKVTTNYVVIAGNPSQKFFNHELENECGPNGYLNLVPDSLNRDEFKYVAAHSDISVSLYGANSDTYGGTAMRECVELGCMPCMLNCNEYANIAQKADYTQFLVDTNMSNITSKLDDMIKHCIMYSRDLRLNKKLRNVVRKQCSYEETTINAMKKMSLL